jgi:catechol 2,3-dioxygenase-like lactoylglutathione lyase family enzyme
MKRFHVHVSVKNLSESISFYSRLFGADPTTTKPDYAKWMLDDPRINFAISQRGHAMGINHLGFQVDTETELTELRSNIDKAQIGALDQADAACCYAKSDKYWVEDPQGIAWETFHTLGTIPVFGEAAVAAPSDSACCIPLAKQPEFTAESACCMPTPKTAVKAACCG